MRTTCFSIALLFVLAVRMAIADIVFDDGNQHTITEEHVNERVKVSNGTTVVHEGRIVDDGPDSLDVLVAITDESTFIVDGGRVETDDTFTHAINAGSGSRVTIESGYVRSAGLVLDDSELRIAGGILDNVWNCDFFYGGVVTRNSLVTITGGEIQNSGICQAMTVAGMSLEGIGEISGGRISQVAEDTGVGLRLDGTLTFSGGEIAVGGPIVFGVKLDGDSNFLMNGGHMELTGIEISRGVDSGDRARAELRSGTIASSKSALNYSMFRATAQSEMIISGGTYQGEGIGEEVRTVFEAIDNAKMTLSGGTFLFDQNIGIRAENKAELLIIGSDFSRPMFEPIQDASGTITGTLLDGNEFSWSFHRDPTATIRLVPESSGVVLLGLGITALFGLWRR